MLAATRAELILPTDAVPGTSFALLIVKQPKTRGRSAKHHEFLTAMYGRSDPSDTLWPFSASTLRKRFSMLLAALELPERRQRSTYRPYDLASLRGGGAIWLLHTAESPELVRRRGRWISNRLMEASLQEVQVTTYERHVSQKTRDLVSLCAGGFASALQRCVAFLHGGSRQKLGTFSSKVQVVLSRALERLEKGWSWWRIVDLFCEQ